MRCGYRGVRAPGLRVSRPSPGPLPKAEERAVRIFLTHPCCSLSFAGEAIHLGSLIAAQGYVFPISDHVLTLKDDGTFYRFQVGEPSASSLVAPSAALQEYCWNHLFFIPKHLLGLCSQSWGYLGRGLRNLRSPFKKICFRIPLKIKSLSSTFWPTVFT